MAYVSYKIVRPSYPMEHLVQLIEEHLAKSGATPTEIDLIRGAMIGAKVIAPMTDADRQAFAMIDEVELLRLLSDMVSTINKENIADASDKCFAWYAQQLDRLNKLLDRMKGRKPTLKTEVIGPTLAAYCELAQCISSLLRSPGAPTIYIDYEHIIRAAPAIGERLVKVYLDPLHQCF